MTQDEAILRCYEFGRLFDGTPIAEAVKKLKDLYDDQRLRNAKLVDHPHELCETCDNWNHVDDECTLDGCIEAIIDDGWDFQGWECDEFAKRDPIRWQTYERDRLRESGYSPDECRRGMP